MSEDRRAEDVNGDDLRESTDWPNAMFHRRFACGGACACGGDISAESGAWRIVAVFGVDVSVSGSAGLSRYRG